MNRLLNSLYSFLLKNNHKSEAQFIKVSFINEAKIIYEWERGGVSSRLVGRIGNVLHFFGEMYTLKLSHMGVDTMDIGDVLQIHRGIDKEYLGLGYGQDMLAAMCNLAKLNKQYIAIIPWENNSESNYAIKSVESMLSDKSGFKLTPICIVETEFSGPRLFKAKDLAKKINDKDVIALLSNKIGTLSTEMEELETDDGILLCSFGFLVENVSANVSIPVQQNYYKLNEIYEETPKKRRRDSLVSKIRNQNQILDDESFDHKEFHVKK